MSIIFITYSLAAIVIEKLIAYNLENKVFDEYNELSHYNKYYKVGVICLCTLILIIDKIIFYVSGKSVLWDMNKAILIKVSIETTEESMHEAYIHFIQTKDVKVYSI